MGRFKQWLILQESIKRTARGKVYTRSSINPPFFRDIIDTSYGAKFIKIGNVWHMWGSDALHEEMYEALTGKVLDIFDDKGHKTYLNLIPTVVEKDYYGEGFNVFGGGHLGRDESREVVRKFMGEMKSKIFMPNDKVMHK